jgi:CRISPR-associated protein Cas2
MSMTVIVTRDVEARYRGFLSSTMLEIAPGVYTGPRMTKGVRERVWRVLADWYSALGQGAIVMTWRDPSEPGGQGISTLGEPPKTLVEVDGVILVKRAK